MDEKRIKVLLIEDSVFDTKLIKDLCRESCSNQFELDQRENLSEAFKALKEKNFDLILLDLTLPEAEGLETLAKVNGRYPRIPIIVLTRTDDETLALKSVSMGAQDYLIKGQVDGVILKRSIRYGIERKQMEEELRKHRENLEELVAARTVELIESNKQLMQEISKRNSAENSLQAAFNQLKEARAQLIQAEKMEIVGRLASGIAHEVKNPLAIILQGMEYLARKIPSQQEDLATTFKFMAEAVNRADNIVKGMLDFSGVSLVERQSQEIIPIVEKSLVLMKHSFDLNHIEVIRDFKDNLPQVNVDKNKIEQVFLNLFENAVQAMAKGGKLKVRIWAEKVSENDEWVGKRKEDVFHPGEEIIKMEIEDTGTGIPENLLDKVFDPFFTTKRSIGGTGLGLSIVRSIMEMHQGKIKIINKQGGSGVQVVIWFKTEPRGG
ncbi:MAG: ATP-binding protein [Candidatus Omnitrophica bacterium]|nr:ATP-binding protein [Candidatus Omnitrophota bacterium]